MSLLFTATGAARAWVTLVLVLVCTGVAMGFTITYTVHQQRKICGLIVLLDDRQQKLPPAADADTERFRTELHRYRTNLGC